MKEREKFSSRLGFILISAGCAIGIGNVWRFPYITGQYGGAAFVLIYLLFLVILDCLLWLWNLLSDVQAASPLPEASISLRAKGHQMAPLQLWSHAWQLYADDVFTPL